MAITKDQWVEIEKELEGLMPTVNFKLADDEINIRRVSTGEGKFQLCVYINNELEGKWFLGENERPECIPLVWKQRTKAKYSAKFIKQVEKTWGKRAAKKDYPHLHEKHVYHDMLFPKASVLVRQYKKIDGLELITKGEK